MSRYIDADALIEFVKNRYDITWKDDYEGGIKDACVDIIEKIKNMPTADVVDRKKLIQKYHDYQIEWLTSHCDLEFEQLLESWIVRYLHDTANMFILEVE